MSKFKVGDRVRTIEREYSFDPSEGIVRGEHDGSVHVEIVKSFTRPADEEHWGNRGGVYRWPYLGKQLEHIKGDDMPKYKWKGDSLSIVSLYAGGKVDCGEFYDEFCGFIKYSRPSHLGEIVMLKTLIDWAEQDPTRIKWLIKKGYIEEVRSEYDKWLDGWPGQPHATPRVKDDYIEWAKRMPK